MLRVSNKAGRSLQVVFADNIGPGVSFVNAFLALASQLRGEAGIPPQTPNGRDIGGGTGTFTWERVFHP